MGLSRQEKNILKTYPQTKNSTMGTGISKLDYRRVINRVMYGQIQI